MRQFPTIRQKIRNHLDRSCTYFQLVSILRMGKGSPIPITNDLNLWAILKARRITKTIDISTQHSRSLSDDTIERSWTILFCWVNSGTKIRLHLRVAMLAKYTDRSRKWKDRKGWKCNWIRSIWSNKVLKKMSSNKRLLWQCWTLSKNLRSWNWKGMVNKLIKNKPENNQRKA